MTEDRGPDGEPTPETPATDPEPAAPPPLAPYVNQAPAPPPPPVAPPAVAWAPAPAAVAPVTGQRTVLAALAGALLLIGGILGGLAGLAVVLVGGSFAATIGDYVEIPGFSGDPGAFFGGVIAFFGAIILVYSLVYLFAGIGVLRNRGWGRVMGLTVGILSGLIWLGSVTTPDQPGVQSSIAGSLIAFGIHAYIVVVLLFFWRSRPSGA